MLTFSVAQLLAKPEGTKQVHEIDEPIHFDERENLVARSNVIGKVIFFRLEDEISVVIEDFEMDIETECSLCLKKTTSHVLVPSAERLFTTHPEREPLDLLEGNFSVDMKRREIALLEMLRQEILLHLPLNPVCYEGCKGLCDQCGQDLNEKKCSCVRKVIPVKENPFSNLKNPNVWQNIPSPKRK